MIETIVLQRLRCFRFVCRETGVNEDFYKYGKISDVSKLADIHYFGSVRMWRHATRSSDDEELHCERLHTASGHDFH
ncbi:hypothetical protein KIN20_008695 [Parelaphostrongylus tenuis]|uniref:Uncharacterized protein n=1 Tax=Parelaphostrongylus tenuis TaxID=148309 RepID=A0AAD5MN41_PARTN|nr:hypothetical protein KIN20_008695 [Parelaphostrongylus tenuis]